MRGKKINRLFFEIAPVLGYIGVILTFFSLFYLIPLIVDFLYLHRFFQFKAFAIPATVSFISGILLKWRKPLGHISHKQGMLIAALSWIIVSLIGSIPYVISIRASWLNAFFESVSGFTTTGITMFSGLDYLPRSILFYRAMTQWLGGLGILSFALLIIYSGGVAPQLFTAESHKIRTKRVAPGLFNTIRILWLIYISLTLILIFLLKVEGVSLFDAITHSFTTLSTGGFSPHDKSIGYYAIMGYKNSNLIEYTIIMFMLFGGINFLIHYRTLQGDIRAIWDSFEVKLFWLIIIGGTAFVLIEQLIYKGGEIEELFRTSLFQVVAIMTTTGYATKDIGAPIYLGVSKQIFLVLMIIGGSVGSTSGGVKVLRIGILLKLIKTKILSIINPPHTPSFIKVDGRRLEIEEVNRVSALFGAWIFLLIIGGLVTALFSEHNAIQSFSGMASALGNIGPCYISPSEMIKLLPIVKITYIIGMLAGRLEILPILMLFFKNTWR